VIYFEAALTHYLFDITMRKLVAAVPSDAQEDDVRGMVPPFERSRARIHV
jgi:hypothetical protein